ncbi:hypothetical protein Vafri_1861 [Volvox africanus]|nr:hypothetical protein Vafri_1861 [Volvox africanus]
MSSGESSGQDATVIFRLPDSVWESIISRLRTHHRARLRGACRKFRVLVNNTIKKIKLDPTYSEDALQWQLHNRFPSLEHIEIMKPSEVDCFTDQTFAQLALKDLSRLPQLTSFNLENCTQLTVAGMAALALACPRISRLVIPQVCQLCMSDSMLLVLARLPELSKLRVQCCKHCDEVALAYLSDLKRLSALELEDYGQALRQVTQLTSLTSLRSVMVWSDYTVDTVLEANDQGLVGGGGHGHAHGFMHGAFLGPHAGGGGGAVAGGGVEHHPQGPAAGPAPGVNPIMAAAEAAAAAAAVANLNLLQHAEAAAVAAAAALGIGGVGDGGGAGGGLAGGLNGGGGGAGGGGPAEAVLAAALQNGHVDAAFVHQLQLTEQVLNNIFEGKSALLSWVTGMTGLTHVDIQRVDITADDLQRFAALPGLVHLGVGDLNLDAGFKETDMDTLNPLTSVTKLVSHNILNEAHLRTTFPSLRALSCDSADSGLGHISELTGLINLFLWNSPNGAISDAGVAHLSALRRLETFRLEGSTAITDGGWVDFAAAHSVLTRVDLVKCPNISDIGFILSIRYLPRLERVSFADCPLIDTRTLAALLAFCTRLEHLELQDCASVSLASLQRLLSTAARPDLEVVYRKGSAIRTLHCSR